MIGADGDESFVGVTSAPSSVSFLAASILFSPKLCRLSEEGMVNGSEIPDGVVGSGLRLGEGVP